MRTRGEILGSVDRPVLVIYLILVLMGWVNIYAANYSPDFPNIFDTSREYGMQFIWICIGFVMGVGLLLFNGEFFRRNAIIFYGVVLLLLIAVLVFGREVNGAKSWFGVGGFGIQPSEFSKIGTALVIASYLSDVNMKVKGAKELMVTAILIGIPSVLILMQPDPGTLLVFMGFLLVMYREGMIGNIIFLGIGLLFVALTTLFFMFQDVWKDHFFVLTMFQFVKKPLFVAKMLPLAMNIDWAIFVQFFVTVLGCSKV